MSVADALAPASPLAAAVRAGKQALERRDRSRIIEGKVSVVDSLHLDRATKSDERDSRRWDYLLGLDHSAVHLIAVEVHPANTGGAREVVEKKKAAEALLKRELRRGHGVNRWYWIASGNVKITRNTPEARLLDAHRIRLVGTTLLLDEVDRT